MAKNNRKIAIRKIPQGASGSPGVTVEHKRSKIAKSLLKERVQKHGGREIWLQILLRDSDYVIEIQEYLIGRRAAPQPTGKALTFGLLTWPKFADAVDRFNRQLSSK
jgi:hypothetical protein